MNPESRSSFKGWVRVLLFLLAHFFIVGAFQLVGFSLAGYSILDPPTGMSTYDHFVISLFTLAGTVCSVWLFRKHVDKKSFLSLGFQAGHKGKDVFLGLALGFAVMVLGFLFLLLTNQIAVQGIRFKGDELVLSIGFFLSVAFVEELIMRGYILTNLMHSFNKYTAMVISALVFSIMHAFNPNLSWLGLIGLVLAGILLGLSYIYTRSLWFPIALHFSWNFFQGTVFGFNVSGQEFYSIIEQQVIRDNIWTGGSFGFEASVLCILLQLLGIALVYYHYRKAEQCPDADKDEESAMAWKYNGGQFSDHEKGGEY